MNHDEEISAAGALGELLTSAMHHAHETSRSYFYSWERDAWRWLIRYLERNPDGPTGNDWVKTFIASNREQIQAETGNINFQLAVEPQPNKKPA
ncbi:hypothetical protein [Agrobacterium tumefaciens]|uniref:hypothetical protein n=1 Tax=Agrobacterium tumefaciens TaxID=358 RepID=UPI0021D051A5|nr:hypothetical protein [Agrobacterium tumefaciens]UXS01686.1 hypothetical protein FY156_09505 [Agrobacterium tumefaciens]